MENYGGAMQGETRKGPWMEEEDMQLAAFVAILGQRRWDYIARVSGLKRSGKSCRLRWLNYLRPDLKHGRISLQEEEIILRLHACWGNKWSRIASKLPGRTDNEIKNYWRTHLRKKAQRQEQEIVQRQLEDATTEDVSETSNQSSETYSTQSSENRRSVKENTCATSASVLDVHLPVGWQIDDHSFAISPYETYFSDWTSGWMDGHSSLSHHQECSFSDTVWEYCSGSLWDME